MGLGELLIAGCTRALGFAKSLSPRAWLALAGILALVVLGIAHQRHASAVVAAAERRGAERASIEIARRVNKLTDRLNVIAAKARENQRASLHSIAVDVRDLELRGPGRAACAAQLSPSRGAGRPYPPAGPPAVAVDPVPDRTGVQLIGLPFSAALAGAGQCDADRDEVARWRQWFAALPPLSSP